MRILKKKTALLYGTACDYAVSSAMSNRDSNSGAASGDCGEVLYRSSSCAIEWSKCEADHASLNFKSW